MNRREFIQHSALGAVAVSAGAGAARPRAPLVDVNAYLSRWPFRRLWADETPKLVEMLARHGVTSAWTGNFDALLHWDLGAANRWLAEECAAHGGGRLVPFGSVNPRHPDWEEEVRRCHEEYRMPGLRLHPNYHGYKLDGAEFARLLDLATERGLLLQIAISLEDERCQHLIMQVPAVWPEPLVEVLAKRPKARVVLTNGLRFINPVLLRRLVATRQVAFDLCDLESVAAVRRELESVPGLRLLFGSFSPVFVFESAELKLRESGLGEAQLEPIRHQWATDWLRGGRA